MLVLSRLRGEEIIIGEGDNQISVMLVQVMGPNKARIGIKAPKHVSIDRREVRERKATEIATPQ